MMTCDPPSDIYSFLSPYLDGDFIFMWGSLHMVRNDQGDGGSKLWLMVLIEYFYVLQEWQLQRESKILEKSFVKVRSF